jgi:hypothetical protein
MNRQMLEEFHRANDRRPVDVVVGYLRGYDTSPATVREMAEAGCVVLNFCWDDKLDFPGRIQGGRPTSPAAIAAEVDLNLTNAPQSVIRYMVHGGLAMFWPEAASPDLYHPRDVPFDYDVTFVGQKYGRRELFINDLRKTGIDVHTSGRHWPGGCVSQSEMVELYSRSRINLGFSGIRHSKKLMCLKGRDFEVPMSGGLYLTRHNPELDLVYNVGTEIVTYTDARDCAATIRDLLSHPEKADAIRRAGRERALRDHTWGVRFEEAFVTAGVLQPGSSAN